MPLDEYLLMIRSEPEEGWEKEFHRWYNLEHLRTLLTLPEFIWARRYVSIEGPMLPKYSALYGLNSPNVFETESYIKARDTEGTIEIRPHIRNVTRNVYKLIYPEVAYDKLQGKETSHNVLLVVRMEPEEEWEEEFQRWYNEEHVRSLCSVPGFLSGARYVSIDGEPRFMAIYEVENYGVLQTEDYVKARDTEWTLRVRPHFRKQTRNIYLKIYEELKP